MKKLVSVVLLIVMIISATFALAGCNWIFNNGSTDEVPGIYGIKQLIYRDTDGATHNFGSDYEYYLLVLYDGGTGRVLCKPVDGTETSYDVTYTMTMGTGEDADKVTTISVAGFRAPAYTLSSTKEVIKGTTSTASFTFKPKLETLMFRTASFHKNTVKDTIYTVVNRLDMVKLYDKTTDKKIDAAKTKQANTRDSRSGGEDSD